MGLVAHVAVVLLVLLIFVNVASDILYMVPLAVVDVWLIAVNWLVSGRFSRGLTRTGIVAGIGLVVLGASSDNAVGVTRDFFEDLPANFLADPR